MGGGVGGGGPGVPPPPHTHTHTISIKIFSISITIPNSDYFVLNIHTIRNKATSYFTVQPKFCLHSYSHQQMTVFPLHWKFLCEPLQVLVCFFVCLFFLFFYYVFRFCEEDIDQILERRAHVIQLESEGSGSTFSKVHTYTGGGGTCTLIFKLCLKRSSFPGNNQTLSLDLGMLQFSFSVILYLECSGCSVQFST